MKLRPETLDAALLAELTANPALVDACTVPSEDMADPIQAKRLDALRYLRAAKVPVVALTVAMVCAGQHAELANTKAQELSRVSLEADITALKLLKAKGQALPPDAVLEIGNRITAAARQRRLTAAYAKAAEIVRSADPDALALAQARADAMVDAARAEAEDVRVITLREALDAQIEHMVGVQSGQILPTVQIPTGIPTLERSIIWRNGQTIVLAAEPGGGKSAFALHLAIVAALGTVHAPQYTPGRVLFVSLEMDAGEMAARWISSQIQETTNRLDDEWISPGLIDRVSELRAKYRARLDNLVFLEASPGLTMGAIDQRVATLQATPGPPLRLVVIDYVGLLGGDATEEMQLLRVNAIAIKRLAKRRNIPVGVLSQLNQDNTKRDPAGRPTTGAIFGAKQLCNDAGGIVILNRPKGATDGPDGERCEVIVTKNRRGPKGVVEVRYDAAHHAFMEWHK